MVGRTLRLVALLAVAYLVAFLLYRGITVQPCMPEDEESGAGQHDLARRASLLSH